MEDLRGQHVVVTGATGGLGPSLVETFLACNASVTAVDLHRTRLDELRAEMRQHERLTIAESNLTESDGVEKLFETLDRSESGHVTAVMHAVGGFAYAPLHETTDATIDTLYKALLLSTVFVCRAAVRRMLPHKRGRIVLMGGLTSLAPAPNMTVYAAMKAAVAHFAQSLAREVGGNGITVNAILPGTIDTAANRKSMPKADPARWVAPAMIARTALSLFGEGGAAINGALITIPERV